MSAELKRLAAAAKSSQPDNVSWHHSEGLLEMGVDSDEDAAYIAAASPDAILKILAERDALIEALKDVYRTVAQAEVETAELRLYKHDMEIRHRGLCRMLNEELALKRLSDNAGDKPTQVGLD